MNKIVLTDTSNSEQWVIIKSFKSVNKAIEYKNKYLKDKKHIVILDEEDICGN